MEAYANYIAILKKCLFLPGNNFMFVFFFFLRLDVLSSCIAIDTIAVLLSFSSAILKKIL